MRQLVAAALLLSASSARAGFCWPDAIYFYSDPQGEVCHSDLVPLQEQFIEIYLQSHQRPGPISQVHFRADGWLSSGEPRQGFLKEMWSADAVEGDLISGITLTWSQGLGSSSHPDALRQDYHLGTLSIFPFFANWAEPGHQVVLRDISFLDTEGHEFFGDAYGEFTFNSEGECLSMIVDPPGYGWCQWRFTSPPNGSSVAGDFVFRGEMMRFSCWYGGLPVSLIVKLNGAQIGSYSGWGEIQVAQPVELSGIADGDSFTITVETDALHCTPSYSYTYTLDTTAIGRESFSAIKARY